MCLHLSAEDLCPFCDIAITLQKRATDERLGNLGVGKEEMTGPKGITPWA